VGEKQMTKRTVEFFSRPGKSNTSATLEAVQAYLKESGTPVPVIVASISGQTALRARETISDASIPILCVTGAPCWQNLPDISYPLIPEQTREELQSAHVSIVDSVPSSLSDTIEFSYARYGYRSPTWMFIEALLAVGGYGLKTAVECILMATDGGHVPPFTEVVAVGGSGKGADTAVVARSTFSSTAFSSDPDKRFVVHEVLAVPRHKVFYKSIVFGDWSIEETRSGKE
jgi:hypothetical protein